MIIYTNIPRDSRFPEATSCKKRTTPKTQSRKQMYTKYKLLQQQCIIIQYHCTSPSHSTGLSFIRFNESFKPFVNPSLSRNFNTIVLSSVKYKVTTLLSPFFIVILRNPLRCRFHIMRKQLSCRVFSSTTASGTSVPSSLESLRSSMELLSDSVFEVEFLNQEENFRPSCLLVLLAFSAAIFACSVAFALASFACN